MMQLSICAVGRLRAGPERTLCDDYIARFDKVARAHALGPLGLIEVEDKKGGGMAAEADLLTRACPQGALVCVLDERGKTLNSPELADHIGRWRDQGRSHAAFFIGGADGLSPDLRAKADFKLSLGRMVWPHMLARVMLCEQLYRAASILAGTPYHRV